MLDSDAGEVVLALLQPLLHQVGKYVNYVLLSTSKITDRLPEFQDKAWHALFPRITRIKGLFLKFSSSS